MRFATVITLLGLVCSCGSPEEYAVPPPVELDILDTLTVAFVEPYATLQPVRQFMTIVNENNTSTGWCYWETWRPVAFNRQSGVWVMAMNKPWPFRCDENDATDSLFAKLGWELDMQADFQARPIQGNEDIRLWPR